MRSSILLVLLAGCIDNVINAKDAEPPGFDSGDSGGPAGDSGDPPDSGETGAPLEEECNGVDDDGDGEVDEGFPDSDGDGRADCVDEECPALTVGVAGPVDVVESCEWTASKIASDPWDVEVKWDFVLADGTGVETPVAVGNLTDDDGDGRIDHHDTPDVVFAGGLSVYALSGADGSLLWVAPGFIASGGVAVADIDGDGVSDVVGFTRDDRIKAVDATGRELWTSAELTIASYPHITVADLDGDGAVEVIGDTWVVAGADGRSLSSVTTELDRTLLYRTPAVGDLDQDGVQEILIGDVVVDPSGTVLWRNDGAGSGNHAALFDLDGDPYGEVVVTSRDEGIVYDDDGTELARFEIPGGINASAPCVADFDGDGQPEIGVAHYDAMNVFEADGTLVWSVEADDVTGVAGCSAWDVDADGAYELLYAGETSFRIYDGATGEVRFEDGAHSSVTLFEYPTVADLDGDGSAEILVPHNGAFHGVTAYGHAGGTGWAGARPVWATDDFAVTGVDVDGHVPEVPVPPWQADNLFRGTSPYVPEPEPDLVVTITDVCVADCEFGPVQVAVQVANQGAVDVPAGARLAVYALDPDPRIVTTLRLDDVPAGSALEGVVIDLAPEHVGSDGLRVVVDDEGAGEGVVSECDESNNVADWHADTCP